ncbi:MAG: hypothetical protein FJ403_09315 [Verrucomicrobia bacterium]|nr:hypothetical protein [Verrucomicrobiota bacterium]
MGDPKKIRILTVSDIHSTATLLDDLKVAVARHDANVLACVGDVLDAEAKGSGMLPPSECARRIAGLV